VERNEIRAGLRDFAELGEADFDSISIYIDLLVKWNARINLTAVRDAKQMLTRHFGESFFAAKNLIARDWAGSIIDVGSGAGFPGLPLAIWAPQAGVTLIESQGKKAAFLNQVIFASGLKHAKVFFGRAEIYENKADLVTMRAVEKFETILPVSVALVKLGGRLALMVGDGQVESAKRLCSEVKWNTPMQVPGGHSRVLLVGTKSSIVEPE
jgi:16S rRNA (guanine527-N7)-methyltransferase